MDGGEEIECMNEMLGCDDKVDDDVGTGEGWTTLGGIRSIHHRTETDRGFSASSTSSPRVLQAGFSTLHTVRVRTA